MTNSISHSEPFSWQTPGKRFDFMIGYRETLIPDQIHQDPKSFALQLKNRWRRFGNFPMFATIQKRTSRDLDLHKVAWILMFANDCYGKIAFCSIPQQDRAGSQTQDTLSFFHNRCYVKQNQWFGWHIYAVTKLCKITQYQVVRGLIWHSCELWKKPVWYLSLLVMYLIYVFFCARNIYKLLVIL